LKYDENANSLMFLFSALPGLAFLYYDAKGEVAINQRKKDQGEVATIFARTSTEEDYKKLYEGLQENDRVVLKKAAHILKAELFKTFSRSGVSVNAIHKELQESDATPKAAQQTVRV